MASWNEIKAKICKTTDKVVAKTSEVADTAAKHVKVKTIEGKLAEKYEELGRVYYVVLKGEEAEEGKAEAIRATICGGINPHVPASLLQLHPDVTVICDTKAYSLVK